MRLIDAAKVIRSKNAGPCLLTLDLMLPDEATFAYVAARIGPLRRQVAQRYGRSENEVAVLPFAHAVFLTRYLNSMMSSAACSRVLNL